MSKDNVKCFIAEEDLKEKINRVERIFGGNTNKALESIITNAIVQNIKVKEFNMPIVDIINMEDKDIEKYIVILPSLQNYVVRGSEKQFKANLKRQYTDSFIKKLYHMISRIAEYIEKKYLSNVSKSKRQKLYMVGIGQNMSIYTFDKNLNRQHAVYINATNEITRGRKEVRGYLREKYYPAFNPNNAIDKRVYLSIPQMEGIKEVETITISLLMQYTLNNYYEKENQVWIEIKRALGLDDTNGISKDIQHEVIKQSNNAIPNYDFKGARIEALEISTKEIKKISKHFENLLL